MYDRYDYLARGELKYMDFYKELYISSRIRDPRKAKKDLIRGKGHFHTYVLVLARGPEGRPQLEIMHCANLHQPYYRERPPFIVGIAEGRADAIGMVEHITNEAFRMTGDWNAAAYLAGQAGML